MGYFALDCLVRNYLVSLEVLPGFEKSTSKFRSVFAFLVAYGQFFEIQVCFTSRFFAKVFAKIPLAFVPHKRSAAL